MFGVSKPNKYRIVLLDSCLEETREPCGYILASKLHTSRVPHNKTLALVDVSTHQAHDLKSSCTTSEFATLECMCACQCALPNNYVDFKVSSSNRGLSLHLWRQCQRAHFSMKVLVAALHQNSRYLYLCRIRNLTWKNISLTKKCLTKSCCKLVWITLVINVLIEFKGPSITTTCWIVCIDHHVDIWKNYKKKKKKIVLLEFHYSLMEYMDLTSKDCIDFLYHVLISYIRFLSN